MIMDYNTTGPSAVIPLFANKSTTVVKAYDKEKKSIVYSVGFICTVLFVAVVLRETLKKLHFPYTVFLFIFGAILGILDYFFVPFRDFTAFAKKEAAIQAFLPVILFDYSFRMNPHMFAMAFTECIILALPGFAFCAALSAVFAKTILTPYNWNWLVCILFGIILASTDSSAIVGILRKYSVQVGLITIIEGEAMLNSGIALVLSKTMLRKLDNPQFTFEDGLLYFIQSSFGAVALGYVIAALIIALIRRTENDTEIEVTFTFCATYITYFVSEVFLDLSGILAVVVLGVAVSSYKSNINYEEEETTSHQFWEALCFWCSSLIFTIVGVLISSSAIVNFDFSDIGFIIASYFMMCTLRAFMVGLIAPLIIISYEDFTWKSGTILTWGGMRGAIGLVLVLLTRHKYTEEVVNKMLIQVSGVIVMTLIFNNSTIHFLLRLLGIGQVTDRNMESITHTIHLLRDTVHLTEKMTRMNKYLSGADWNWVHTVTKIENPYEKEMSAYSAMMKRAFETFRGHCQECDAEITIEPNAAELRQMEIESRLLVLRALQTSVVNQHEDYGVLRRTLGHLNTCIEQASDSPFKQLQAEYVIRRFLNISPYIQILQTYMMRLFPELDNKRRENRIQMYLSSIQEESGKVRQRCIKTLLSWQFNSMMYWAVIVNTVPIVGEFTAILTPYRIFPMKSRAKDSRLTTDITFFEIINGLLALLYVFDAFIRIGALGFKKFFRNKSNNVDFIVMVSSVIQLIYAMVLLTAFRYTYTSDWLYVLLFMNTVRLLRLLKLIFAGVFANILNEVCSKFFNAFDLAIGFIVANEEVTKSAFQIVEYEECAENARTAAENNIYEVITSKMNESLSLPRYMKTKKGIENYLKNVPWISNNEILEKIMADHGFESYLANEVIQESGQKHMDMKVLYQGIIQISGTNTGEKTDILPNTDSVRFFTKKGHFFTHTHSPRVVGVLGYLQNQTPSVTRVTCTNDCQMISIPFETVSQIEEKFRDLSFHMWRPLALQIALTVLNEEHAYENWPDEKLKIYLEEGIFPDLLGTEIFDINHQVVADIVLIQGRVKDNRTKIIYVGPAYIPRTVRSLTLLDDPVTRPRVVMLLMREEKNHARSIMRWVKPDDIKPAGLCLVHKVRKMTLYDTQLKESSERGLSSGSDVRRFSRPTSDTQALFRK